MYHGPVGPTRFKEAGMGDEAAGNRQVSCSAFLFLDQPVLAEREPSLAQIRTTQTVWGVWPSVAERLKCRHG